MLELLKFALFFTAFGFIIGALFMYAVKNDGDVRMVEEPTESGVHPL